MPWDQLLLSVHDLQALDAEAGHGATQALLVELVAVLGGR